MAYDLSPEACAKISARAVEIARQNAPEARWDSTGGRAKLRPFSQKGQIGINVPPSARHLMFQNKGTASKVRSDLKGRVIPIRDKDTGQVVFRYVKASKVGKFREGPARRVTTRDSDGKLIVRQMTRRGWTHPGLEPKNFMEKALKQAIAEYMDELPVREVWKVLQKEGLDPLKEFEYTIGKVE